MRHAGGPARGRAADRITPITSAIRDAQPTATTATVVTVAPSVPGAAVNVAAVAASDAPKEGGTDKTTVADVVLRYLAYCDRFSRTPAGERASPYGNVL